jgi:hypothetical protein
MMRRSRLFVIAFMALLLSGCGLLAFLQNDSRVTVVRLSQGVYQVSTNPDNLTANALRINSSAIITDWSPRAGCIRITTEVGGTDKALKCSVSPVDINTFGTLDVGLVKR